MEENLTLFTNSTEYEIGKNLWKLSTENPNSSLGFLIKQMGILETAGRRAYWSYVVLEVCELKERLRKEKKLYLLLGIKNYIFSNYSKLFKVITGSYNTVTDELKDYIYNFFINTYELSEKELRRTISKEIRRLYNSANKTYPVDTRPVIDGEKELLKDKIDSLNKRISELEKENKELNTKVNDTDSLINQFSEKIKKEIIKVNRIYFMFISALILILVTLNK